ncbi:MAG: hypothetical protein ACXU7O_09345 [Croceibacterium sp.]
MEIVGDDDCRPCDGPTPEPVPPLRDECGSPCPNPQRPQRPQGTDTGRQSDPTPLTPGDLHHPNPPGVWGGQRQDLHLPFLFIRAFPGDLGARPLNVPFWESPDIFIVPGVDPTAAPAIPAAFGDIALANQPNTLYAHVWNFGQAASAEAVVEFYWCDPSLGITSASTHLIAQTAVSLGAKGSGHAHAVVKCPAPWTPTFLNGGHECLLVRVWDNPSDLPGLPRMDARVNRHVGQRNVHVVAAGAKAMARTVSAARDLFPPAAKALTQPILLRVGPLFNEPARVFVERVAPNNMPWLQLRSGERGRFPAGAPPSGVALLSRPVASGGGFSAMGLAASHCVSDDDQMVAFMTSDTTPARGEAHVYRVSATQGGVLFGGYTVVVLG